MSSELDKVGPERGRDLPTERGRLLQLSSKVKQEMTGSVQDVNLSLLQESNQFGRGRLLEMSRMRQGGGGGGAQGSRSGHNGQPKGILVIR